jgi:lipoprotein NlpI
MFRIILAGMIWLAAVSAACAAGYDEYSQGLAAKNRGDYDLALTKFTAAINAGDLNSELIPVAYFNRGILRLQKRACADAVDDFTAALKSNPSKLDALEGRAAAYACLRKFDQALADYNLVLDAKIDAAILCDRGQVYWLSGNFAAAAEDFQRATVLKPKYVYSWLWLESVRARAGNLDIAQIKQDVRNLDSDAWPFPAFGLFEGQLTPDALMTAAGKNASGKTLQGQQCEASFYSAEWWLAKGKPDFAKPMLELASKNCPETFVELELAAAELAQLK